MYILYVPHAILILIIIMKWFTIPSACITIKITIKTNFNYFIMITILLNL